MESFEQDVVGLTSALKKVEEVDAEMQYVPPASSSPGSPAMSR
jgi:hypothetical protein